MGMGPSVNFFPAFQLLSHTLHSIYVHPIPFQFGLLKDV